VKEQSDTVKRRLKKLDGPKGEHFLTAKSLGACNVPLEMMVRAPAGSILNNRRILESHVKEIQDEIEQGVDTGSLKKPATMCLLLVELTASGKAAMRKSSSEEEESKVLANRANWLSVDKDRGDYIFMRIKSISQEFVQSNSEHAWDDLVDMNKEYISQNSLMDQKVAVYTGSMLRESFRFVVLGGNHYHAACCAAMQTRTTAFKNVPFLWWPLSDIYTDLGDMEISDLAQSHNDVASMSVKVTTWDKV
jgi:hypothetical protein